MSPAPDAPVELSFGAAYERLQEVATELSADASMPPERLIALLKEGKGLERALRDHLDRIEQEVRAIDEGDGATPFRIVDAGGPSAAAAAAAPAPAPAPAPALAPAPAAAPAAAAEAAVSAPSAAAPAAAGTAPGRAAEEATASADGPAAAPRRRAPARRATPEPEAPPAERTPAPDAAPTLGFLGADDDIPF
jgi:exonuclease VII small subunit